MFNDILPPRTLKENKEYRSWILQAAIRNRRNWPRIIERCANDLPFYVNSFVWQYNPREKKAEVGPFITWPFQDRAFATIQECIDNGTDLVIEKSREMGASWMCLIAMDHPFIFKPWQKFLSISRSADAVDNEDPDCLFWKIDFMHRHLPDWMKPPVKRRSMYYGNERNGSTITGQASTGKAGVGGRATAMFVDEFSQIREDYEVLHRTADTTACRIFNFTHTDISNAAAELSRRVDMKKLRLHWSEHPAKNPGLYQYEAETGKVEVRDKQYSFPTDFQFVMDGKLRSPWYDRECVRRGSARAIAMDLDIDPRGSMAQFVDPQMIRLLKQTFCTPPFWEGELHFDRDSGRPLELVQLGGGHLRLWLHPRSDGKIVPGRFTAGADIATGSGATPSCLAFLDSATGEQVAEYSNAHIEPQEFAALAVSLCWLFKSGDGEGAAFAWEQQGPGAVFGRKVVDLGYRNIFYRQNEQKLIPANYKGAELQPGWYPSPENKRLLLEDLRGGLSSHACIVRSENSLDEFLSFRYAANGTVEHAGETGGDNPADARVNHGDNIIALGLAWKMARRSGLVLKPAVEEVKVGSLAWRRELAEQRSREDEAWAS